jgi:hypothetical protein
MENKLEYLRNTRVKTSVDEDGTIIQTTQRGVYETAKETLKIYDGVVGIGEGKKIKDGKKTDIDSIYVYVKQKKCKKDVKSGEVIPSVIDGKATDVIELGEVYALGVIPENTKESITGRYRPLVGGCSIGETTVTAGTNGIPGTRDGQKGNISNSHVILKNMRDDLGKQRPLEIYQPGPHDGGGTPANNLYGDTVSAVVVPVGMPAYNDVGFVANRNMQDWTPKMHAKFKEYTGYDLPVGMATLEVGDEVFKVGRTTGLTIMNVFDLFGDVSVNYGKDGNILHKACIILTRGSNGGDSGSCVFKMINGKPYLVAYLFAGSTTHTICHEIQNACNILRFIPAYEEPHEDDDDDDGDDDEPSEPLKKTIISTFDLLVGNVIPITGTIKEEETWNHMLCI